MMATLTGIMLGMVTSSAKDTYDAGNGVITSMAVDVLTLDQVLDNYGAETKDSREALRAWIGNRVAAIQAGEAYFEHDHAAVLGVTGTERIYDLVHGLDANTDLQKSLRLRALDIIGGRVSYGDGSLAQQRWFFSVKPASIPHVFLVVVFFWLVLEFFCIGLFSKRNGLVITAIIAGSLVVSSAIFLMLELENPMNGFLRVPTESLELALELMNK